MYRLMLIMASATELEIETDQKVMVIITSRGPSS